MNHCFTLYKNLPISGKQGLTGLTVFNINLHNSFCAPRIRNFIMSNSKDTELWRISEESDHLSFSGETALGEFCPKAQWVLDAKNLSNLNNKNNLRKERLFLF